MFKKSIIIGLLLFTCTLPVRAGEPTVLDTRPWDEDMPAGSYPSLGLVSAPYAQKRSLGPILTAKSALAIDIDTGVVLFSKNIYQRLPIASLTKLITVLTAMDLVSLDHVVTVPGDVGSIEPSRISLRPADTMTVKNLIYACLIHSANDAAYAISTLRPDFSATMNEKVQELGLEDTHFTNAIGWDEPDNYSTAYDLSKIMRLAFAQPLIADAITTQTMDIVSEKGNTYTLHTTNKLFGSFLNEVGGKTGTTDEAGPSFVNIFKTSNGHRILTVVLNSPDRFTETKVLSYWVMQNYSWR